MAKSPFLRKRVTGVSAAVAVLAAGCGGGLEGSAAPAFSLPDAAGDKVALGDFKGTPVVLSFWATWCGPCREELPELARLQESMGDKVNVVMVSSEPASKTRPFLESRRIDLWSLTDADGSAHRDYGVRGIPSLFLIDGEGIVRQQQVGYRPGVGDWLKEEIAAL